MSGRCPFCLVPIEPMEDEHICPHGLLCEFDEDDDFELRCSDCRETWWDRLRREAEKKQIELTG
jgi:hypothetical protein